MKREHVTLKELIGGGQFGNVYKGILAKPVSKKLYAKDILPVFTKSITKSRHVEQLTTNLSNFFFHRLGLNQQLFHQNLAIDNNFSHTNVQKNHTLSVKMIE